MKHAAGHKLLNFPPIFIRLIHDTYIQEGGSNCDVTCLA